MIVWFTGLIRVGGASIQYVTLLIFEKKSKRSCYGLGAVIDCSQAILFEYDLLARSGRRTVADLPPNSSRKTLPNAVAQMKRKSNNTTRQHQPIAKHQENLVDEISGLLGKARGTEGLAEGNSLQDMGRNLIADLKDKLGRSRAEPKPAPTTKAPPARLQPSDLGEREDPKAKYMAKVQ